MKLNCRVTSFLYPYQMSVFDPCKSDLTWNDCNLPKFDDLTYLMDALYIRWCR